MSVKNGKGVKECERSCDTNNQCKFYFFTLTKFCVLYSSCDEFRVAQAKGTTYEKQERGIVSIRHFITSYFIENRPVTS